MSLWPALQAVGRPRATAQSTWISVLSLSGLKLPPGMGASKAWPTLIPCHCRYRLPTPRQGKSPGPFLPYLLARQSLVRTPGTSLPGMQVPMPTGAERQGGQLWCRGLEGLGIASHCPEGPEGTEPWTFLSFLRRVQGALAGLGSRTSPSGGSATCPAPSQLTPCTLSGWTLPAGSEGDCGTRRLGVGTRSTGDQEPGKGWGMVHPTPTPPTLC